MRQESLYSIIRDIMRQAKEPMTCGDLYDNPKVRKYAATPNRVSDYLGSLWRKDYLIRVPAPKTPDSSARWAYTWNEKKFGTKSSAAPLRVVKPATAPTRPATAAFSSQNLSVIDEGDKVRIELADLSITIERR